VRIYNTYPAGNYWLFPVLGGFLIAIAATIVLRFPFVWAGLVIVGLAVGVLSLIAKDFKTYWMAIFALVLPLEIKKLMIDSEYVREIARINGPPLGELPGPVLYLSDLPFLILMAYWLFEIIYTKKKVFFPKSNWMALAFLAWAGFSLIKAPILSYGFFDLLRMFKFYLLYLYVANNVRSRKEVKTLINFFLIGVILQGLICLNQYFSQSVSYIFGNLFGQQDLYTPGLIKKYGVEFFMVTEESEAIRRASGTVGPINQEALYFEFLLPIAFLLSLTAAKFWSRVFNISTLVLGLLGLIVTFSRGGLIGLIVGMLTVLLLSRMFKLISNRKFLAFVLLGLGICASLAPIVQRYIMTRPEAALARFHLAEVGLKMIKAHPVLGVGLNNHMVLKQEYEPWHYALPMPPHNQYIIIASEIGIPGLIFFSGFLVLTCMLALSAARTTDLYLASIAVGILGALVAISVHMLIDFLGTHTNFTLLWLYAGLAAALSRWNLKPSEKTL
jgi:O-antigen ligase